MNPLCVFFAMFAALSLVRNIIERRKRARLLRLLVAALRAHRQAGENKSRRYDPPYGLFLINNPSLVPAAVEWGAFHES